MATPTVQLLFTVSFSRNILTTILLIETDLNFEMYARVQTEKKKKLKNEKQLIDRGEKSTDLFRVDCNE